MKLQTATLTLKSAQKLFKVHKFGIRTLEILRVVINKCKKLHAVHVTWHGMI